MTVHTMSPGPVAPPRSALFVDLEGTLVEGADFGTQSGPMTYLPGAAQALGLLARDGFAIVVVTNQSGLALGRFGRSAFALREAIVQQQLRETVGLRIDSFLVCPHRPDEAGRPACLCRKPAPGLLLRAARTHGLDLASSWMVGDSADDIEAGRRAGCRTVLIQRSASAESPVTHRLRRPDRRCSEWAEVVHEVMAGRTGRQETETRSAAVSAGGSHEGQT